MRFIGYTIVAATLALPLAAFAAEPRMIGTYRDWSAHIAEDGRATVCYLHSVPKKEQGRYTRRGDTYMQVAERPAENVKDEVSVTAGYTYKPQSEVRVQIGSNRFELFTERENAWARDGKTDAQLVAAMKAGSTMVVRGTSSRGTLTTDTYSLLGFTAAYEAMTKACRAARTS